MEIYTGDKEKGRAAGGVPGGSRPKPLLARTSARQQGGGSRTCITCDRRTVAWAPPFAAAFSAHLSGAVQVDTGLDRTPQAALPELEVLEAAEEEADDGGRSRRLERDASMRPDDVGTNPTWKPELLSCAEFSSDSRSARSRRSLHLRRSRQMYKMAIAVR